MRDAVQVLKVQLTKLRENIRGNESKLLSLTEQINSLRNFNDEQKQEVKEIQTAIKKLEE